MRNRPTEHRLVFASFTNWLTARYVRLQALRVCGPQGARGLEAVEYVLIAAVIIVGVAVAYGFLRDEVNTQLDNIKDQLDGNANN